MSTCNLQVKSYTRICVGYCTDTLEHLDSTVAIDTGAWRWMVSLDSGRMHVFEKVCSSVEVAAIYFLRNLSPRSRVHSKTRRILRLEVV